MIKTLQKQRSLAQNGNAMIYVLLAIALLGFLTVTLSRQNNQSDGQDINDDLAELYANELIEYAATAENVINMMVATGTEINELDFINPSSAGFNSGSHIHKVFHPVGGGLNYQEDISNKIGVAANNPKWIFSNNVNVEWTSTIANDALLAAKAVKKEVCENINKQVFGSKDIPQFTSDDLSSGLTNVICPECDGYPNFCALNSAGTVYSYFSIIAAQ